MTAGVEKRWEWDQVAPGPVSAVLVTEVSPASIADYARRVRNGNQAYALTGPRGLAMPTMVFDIAPLRRNAVAIASGYIALEWARVNPRQTPFAKCVVRWFSPIRVGDVITSRARVLEKYERRGNKFVTFRVEAINQHGTKVAEYDYTCIFEYAKGQKTSAARSASGVPHRQNSETEAVTIRTGMAEFESIRIGDDIPSFQIAESQETIDGARDPDREGDRPPKNIHNDLDFARQGIFAGTVNAGVTSMAYVAQMLERSFHAQDFYDGGIMTFKAIEPFRPGDAVTFSGKVTGKRVADGRKLVDFEIKGVDEVGRLIGVGEVTLNVHA